jgi:YgiT-type zinc finger domain-containing protein
MTCDVCGAEMAVIKTDLPLKVRNAGIVILKGLPVSQCGNCRQYLLEDRVLAQVDEILQRVDAAKELEIVRYGA